MIIGGGAAATMLIKEYQLSTRRIKICCIIDDNPEKKGKRLNDIPIIEFPNNAEYKASMPVK